MSEPRPDSIDAILRRAFASQAAAPRRECPDASTLASWFDRSLPRAEFARVDAHVVDCAHCQSIAASMARAEEAMSSDAPLRGFRRMLDLRLLAPAVAGLVAIVFIGRAFRQPAGGLRDLQKITLSEKAAAPEIAQEHPAPKAALPENPAGNGAALQQAPSHTFSSAVFPGNAQSVQRPRLSAQEVKASPPGAPARGTVMQGALAMFRGPEGTRTQSETEFSAGVLAGPSSRQTAPAGPAVASAPPVSEPLSYSPGMTAVGSPDRSFTWLIGAQGRIFKRKGNGPPHPQASGVSADLIDGQALSATVCWIVGRSGTVLLTTDGEHWKVLPPPTEQDLTSVQAQSASSAIVVTEEGRGFITNNGGKTWARL